MYAAATLTIPARIFPIYFPMGNLATGFFIILSLLAGVVGFTCSITGLNNVFLWNAPNLHAAYASALASLSLTLLALGLMPLLSHSVFTWNLSFLLSSTFNSFMFIIVFLINVRCRFACKEINIGWTDSALVNSSFFFLLITSSGRGICE